MLVITSLLVLLLIASLESQQYNQKWTFNVGSPHCPKCVDVAFITAFISVTRVYFLYFLSKDTKKRRALPLVPVYD